MTYGAGIQRGPMAADNFTQIANALFRDRRISFKAKGIFGLISTHRDGWRVTVAELVRSSTDGKSAVTAGLKELEKYGYLIRDRERRPDGTLGDAVYSITDMPAHLFDLYGDEAPTLPMQRRTRRSGPKSENPALENPAQADQTTKNTTPEKTSRKKTKPRPSVRTTRASARSVVTASSDGGTDGHQVEPNETKQPKAPAAEAVAPTEGVLLLTAIGNEKPEFRLTGKPLAHQGLAVDGLLASGWTSEQIRDVVASRPLPAKTRSVGAVISRRLRDAAASPPPCAAPVIPGQAQGWRDQDDEPTWTPPAYSEAVGEPAVGIECDGNDGMCGLPVLAQTRMCASCSGWDRCDCGTWHSGTGRCPACIAEWNAAEAAMHRFVDDAPLIFHEPTEAERLIGGDF
ncbi:hypothetical protein [Streptomyces hesseae]|uniref:Helix-turn-helix domain-containing protein n=1 Tax=Streptomyces hesseae TaxID=3075519 RepID=A0ABU2SLV3_9ACTN|nr:hypothetical protein [Streptomyces sp. DSM 40473]MDT0449967.1 hypothetical protein [Streptomyces sp. DSM 40473]